MLSFSKIILQSNNNEKECFFRTIEFHAVSDFLQEESIPVGYVLPAFLTPRDLLTETPWTETPTGQRPPLDRDPHWTETTRQKNAWTENPLEGT